MGLDKLRKIMKKLIVVSSLILSWWFTHANDKVVVLENLFRINNQIAGTIETLNSSRQEEFYIRFYQLQTIQELNNLNNEFFEENASALNSNFNDLISNLNAFKSYEYTEEDYKAFAVLHPSNEEPPAASCKCMPCYERCASDWAKMGWMVVGTVMSWTANGIAVGGMAGGTAGAIGGASVGGIGAAPGSAMGALTGSQLGAVMGFTFGCFEAQYKVNKLKGDCWAVHCEGKDLNPEGTDGPGFPSGGPKWKKIEWGGF